MIGWSRQLAPHWRYIAAWITVGWFGQDSIIARGLAPVPALRRLRVLTEGFDA